MRPGGAGGRFDGVATEVKEVLVDIVELVGPDDAEVAVILGASDEHSPNSDMQPVPQ